MYDHVVFRPGGVENLRLALGRENGPGIAYLAARFPVEGCHIGDDEDLLPFQGHIDGLELSVLVPDLHLEDIRVGLRGIVTHKPDIGR